MIVGYSATDMGGVNAVGNWRQDQILNWKYSRDQNYDHAAIMAWVRAAPPNGPGDTAPVGTPNSSYRHYVPYNQIFKHVTDTLHGQTRTQIMVQLNAWVGNLAIPFDWVWNQVNTNRLAYDAAVEWAIEAICDVKENIYWGPGAGDGAGTQVDVPNGPTAVAQLARVQACMNGLNLVLGSNFPNFPAN